MLIKEDDLVRLALFRVPLLISAFLLFLNSDLSEIRYSFQEDYQLEASPEFAFTYLQDPANFWAWMDFKSPKLKHITAGTDSIGSLVNIVYHQANGKELVFKSRLMSRTILTPSNGSQAMFQVKYLLENDFFDLTIDHNLVDSYYKSVGCGMVTYIRAKVKSKILGSSMILGWTSFHELLKEAHGNLLADIQKAFKDRGGLYKDEAQGASLEMPKETDQQVLNQQDEVLKQLLERQHIDLQKWTQKLRRSVKKGH